MFSYVHNPLHNLPRQLICLLLCLICWPLLFMWYHWLYAVLLSKLVPCTLLLNKALESVSLQFYNYDYI